MEKSVSSAIAWEEGLSFPGYSLDVAPKEYRLTPEARAAIAEELFSRMSHNDAVRAESMHVAAGFRYMML